MTAARAASVTRVEQAKRAEMERPEEVEKALAPVRPAVALAKKAVVPATKVVAPVELEGLALPAEWAPPPARFERDRR